MSQEPEDVKPKLNLNIAYEGQSVLTSLSEYCSFELMEWVRYHRKGQVEYGSCKDL